MNIENWNKVSRPNSSVAYIRNSGILHFSIFSLPPPSPSASDELSKSYFNSCKTLYDVDSVLSNAMEKCGYIRRSYYFVLNGFAMVT
jgi:hypothetical protein